MARFVAHAQCPVMRPDSQRPSRYGRTYRVVLSDDRRGEGRIIEYDAHGAESVLMIVDRHCKGRLAEVIEDGRSLGRVRNHRNGGFWTVHAAEATHSGEAHAVPLPGPRAIGPA